ncbi:ABC transporter ATP-binding protein [Candidatus Saccharibacteria bacterium]|nr:ABC transporter ATP-binding protein [Candidatus Saccharibacteria bacterium]
MKLVECKNLTKKYGEKEALREVNLEIPRGKIIGLLGKNGSGKTTLIKLINDLLTPTSGEVLFKGKPLGVESKRRISYLPERTYLNRALKVRQVLDYFADFYDNFDTQKARRLITKFDLEEEQKIVAMSKGMQEKLQLALVMARNVDLYVLDEPLGGVDPATRDYILDVILENFNPRASLMISTHLIADVERILDEVIFINRGEIIAQEGADDLRAKKHASIDEIFRKEFYAG